jgi:hypothetical protein|tara:strand:- start:6383 stop:6688 length:306 start_codon:yes stop_codon:yes gene_type:complete
MNVFIATLQVVMVLLVFYHRGRHSLSDYEKWSADVASFERHIKYQLMGAGPCLLSSLLLSKENSGWVGVATAFTGATSFYLTATALLFWWDVKRWSRLNDE